MKDSCIRRVARLSGITLKRAGVLYHGFSVEPLYKMCGGGLWKLDVGVFSQFKREHLESLWKCSLQSEVKLVPLD